jgi:hypothetical protein
MIGIFDIGRRLLTWFWTIAFVAAGIAGFAHAAPSWASKTSALFSHYVSGWTERACERNKEACLNAKFADLDSLHTELATAINALGTQKGRIARDLSNRERDLAGNTALLEEGRQRYAKALQAGGTVRFAGRDYTAEALRRQLEVLYQEAPALQSLVMQVRTMDEALDRKLNDLMVKKTKVRAARDLLPSQIELVRANVVIGDIDATLRDVTRLSDGVSADVAELKDISGWLSTTNELIKRKLEADRSTVPSDFDKWLGAGRSGTP